MGLQMSWCIMSFGGLWLCSKLLGKLVFKNCYLRVTLKLWSSLLQMELAICIHFGLQWKLFGVAGSSCLAVVAHSDHIGLNVSPYPPFGVSFFFLLNNHFSHWTCNLLINTFLKNKNIKFSFWKCKKCDKYIRPLTFICHS